MSGTAPTVYIVDDASEVVMALSRLLDASGYQVSAFVSAERFLEQHDAEAPGCLLLDVCMPGLSGIELQRTLAGSPCARPIVFLSGKGDVHIGVHAMKEGAVDFLTKPIDHAQLVAAVDKALKLGARVGVAIEPAMNCPAATGSVLSSEVMQGPTTFGPMVQTVQRAPALL
jgi:FixJ family two-component response regulator